MQYILFNFGASLTSIDYAALPALLTLKFLYQSAFAVVFEQRARPESVAGQVLAKESKIQLHHD